MCPSLLLTVCSISPGSRCGGCIWVSKSSGFGQAIPSRTARHVRIHLTLKKMLGAERKRAITGGRSQQYQQVPIGGDAVNTLNQFLKILIALVADSVDSFGSVTAPGLIDERRHVARGVSRESTAPSNCLRQIKRIAAACKHPVTYATAQPPFNAPGPATSSAVVRSTTPDTRLPGRGLSQILEKLAHQPLVA
jgi:hypothetical protein